MNYFYVIKVIIELIIMKFYVDLINFEVIIQDC